VKTRDKIIAALVALSLLLVGFAAGFVTAHRWRPPFDGPLFKRPPRTKADVERRVQHLTEKLTLSVEQQTKLRAILEDAVGRAFPQEDERMENAKKVMTEARQQIEQLLTEEQKKIFEELRPEGRGPR
jgi:Spy/CpxP family protein refolding chaperone